ncbi:probably inactive leucine-rich repeat receptor-like protein kinase At5g48380 [Aegilops tauschii subsp. strangulata]|uniref:probably inactive leucine-rich repeat receptor-like protein kinase At5g48380 n=1 Tax=Aegilops tauschii subsp. strangulata TaxID=200361 RepID=UPI003CC86E6A
MIWLTSCLCHSMFDMADGAKFLLLFLLLNISTLCFCTEQDIQCLKTVQQSVIDPNSVLKSSWNFENETDGFICCFTAVECWFADENMVLSLRLGNLGLQGAFPQGLQDCASMTGMGLSNNSFSGPNPPDFSRQVPYLTSLDLSYNSFSRSIPQNISNMTYLNLLNLQHNQLNGQIPPQFDLLTRVLGQLTSFNVADNLLLGPIPTFAQDFSPLYFAGNRDLCGAPLDECPRSRRWRLKPIRLRRINDQSSIGAAVGFVLGLVVAFYFHLFRSERLLPCVFRI